MSKWTNSGEKRGLRQPGFHIGHIKIFSTMSRWIKYEEDLETERGDWGPPHIASLSFHSLMQLRKRLEQGGFMLDTRTSDLSSLLTDVVSRLVKEGKLEEELKSKVLSVLLYRHRHVQHRHKTSFTFKPFKRTGSRDNMEVEECFSSSRC